MTERKAPAAADTPDPRTSEPYSLPPKDRTWSKVSQQAKAKFEAGTRCDDWGLATCLMGMGRIWFEIVGFDHESDHYTKYATNIELIWYYYYESRRLWNLSEPKWPRFAKFDLLGAPCTSVADGSIEFFDMVVVDVLDAVRGEVRLVNETSVDQEWAAKFSERLSQRLERLGVANKPVDALNLLKVLERDLPAERTEDTSVIHSAANIATTGGETTGDPVNIGTTNGNSQKNKGGRKPKTALTPTEKKVIALRKSEPRPAWYEIGERLKITPEVARKAYQSGTKWLQRKKAKSADKTGQN